MRWRNDAAKHARERRWFRRWVVEGYSVRQLSEQSGHSTAKLYRMMDYNLKQSPPQTAVDWGRCQHFIFDGTFLHRPGGIVALMDAETHTLVRGQYGVSESSEVQLMAFFEPLIRDGLRPLSFTVDGNPQLTRVLRKLWPGVAVQRCLIHVQRQGLLWCRNYPKTAYARKLRDLFLQVIQVRTKTDRDVFLEAVREWEAMYGHEIAAKPEIGPVFSDVKRARSMLLRALPDMFHYLDDPHIPISTNGLEGYFSRLKLRYRQHRGMSKGNLASYFHWYFYLVPK